MAKKIREHGIVLGKIIKPATEGFTGQDGRAVPAMPERPTIIVGCGEVNGEEGIQDLLIVRVVVGMDEYAAYKFMDIVDIGYEYNGENKTKNAEIFGVVNQDKAKK